jgi:DNA-binding PadR family transcriptional regulator
MDTINRKEIALLGLLCEKPRHAYELEQEVRDRSMRSWTDLSMSSIYKTLKKLEAAGLTSCRVELSEKNIAQKIHQVTENGRETLKGNLASVAAGFDPEKELADLLFNNLFVFDTAELRENLRAYRLRLESHVRGYGDLVAYLKSYDCPQFRLAIATRRLNQYQAELSWLDGYAGEILKKGAQL